MQNVFIIGSKGIPAAYGGYETFVDKLTEYQRNNDKIKYHVACKGKENKEYIYHNARCFMIKVPDVGSAQAIYYDVAALKECCRYIEKKQVKQPVIYILACRIGPFIRHYVKKYISLEERYMSIRMGMNGCGRSGMLMYENIGKYQNK